MNKLELFELLRPIVQTVTGVPTCIYADQNVKAPTGTYAAIRPKQSIRRRGQADVNWKPGAPVESVDITRKTHVITECSINFYRDGAEDYAEMMLEADKRPDVYETLYRAGVGWLRAGPVNNLTALQANNWEPRAQISVFLIYDVADTVNVNSIESAEIQVQNEDADTLLTVDITV